MITPQLGNKFTSVHYHPCGATLKNGLHSFCVRCYCSERDPSFSLPSFFDVFLTPSEFAFLAPASKVYLSSIFLYCVCLLLLSFVALSLGAKMLKLVYVYGWGRCSFYCCRLFRSFEAYFLPRLVNFPLTYTFRGVQSNSHCHSRLFHWVRGHFYCTSPSPVVLAALVAH